MERQRKDPAPLSLSSYKMTVNSCSCAASDTKVQLNAVPFESDT